MPSNYERLQAAMAAASDPRKPTLKFRGGFLTIVKKEIETVQQYIMTQEILKTAYLEGLRCDKEWLQSQLPLATANPKKPLFAEARVGALPVYWHKEDGEMVPVFVTPAKYGLLMYATDTHGEWVTYEPVPEGATLSYIPPGGSLSMSRAIPI